MTAVRSLLTDEWWRAPAAALLVLVTAVPSCMTARLWRDDATGLLGARREAGYEVQQRSPVELCWPASPAGALRVVAPGGQCFELTPSGDATLAGLRDCDAVRVFVIDDAAGGRRWLLQPAGFLPVPPRGDLCDLAMWIEADGVPCTVRPVEGPSVGDRSVARGELWQVRSEGAEGGERTATKLALTPVTVVVDVGSGVLWVLYQWVASAPSGNWLAYNLR